MRLLHSTGASALMRVSGCAPMDRSRGSILGRSPLVQTSFPELGFFLFSDFWYNLMLYAGTLRMFVFCVEMTILEGGHVGGPF